MKECVSRKRSSNSVQTYCLACHCHAASSFPSPDSTILLTNDSSSAFNNGTKTDLCDLKCKSGESLKFC